MSLAGQQFGHYRVVRQIGQGGMGEVYLAEDTRIKRQVAVKVVRSERTPYPNNSATQEAERLFQREMKAISQLDHSHILGFYDFGDEPSTGGSTTYMVMPYRPEGSLLDWLAQRNSSDLLSPQDVGYLLTQAASALQHAHDHNIIHQDVKPSNFLIRTNPEQPTRPDLFLVDFGVAKILSATSTASNSIRGTYTYMAPEQWSGDTVPATDQYALAVMTYQLLTGIVPFQGRPEQIMFQHMSVTPKSPSTINPRLSPAIDAVLLRALAKKPEERFPSISAFAAAFQQALTYDPKAPTIIVSPSPPSQPRMYYADATAPAQPKPLSMSMPRKSGLSSSFYIVGTILLVGAIIVGVLLLNHPSPGYSNGSTGSNIGVSIVPAATATPLPTATPFSTPTNTLVPTAIPYPSYSDARVAITYYYENESDFKGKNVIQSFDSLTYQQETGPVDQPQFIACAQYKFALVSSPNVTADTARHTFTFQYGNGTWSVIDMGNWNSC